VAAAINDNSPRLPDADAIKGYAVRGIAKRAGVSTAVALAIAELAGSPGRRVMGDVSLVAPKLAKLLPMLSTSHDGEVVAAARAIGRTLQSAGLDWHSLAAALAGVPLSDVRPSLGDDSGRIDPSDWHAMAKWARDNDRAASPTKSGPFVHDLAAPCACGAVSVRASSRPNGCGRSSSISCGGCPDMNAHASPLLNAALAYAGAGLPVFPVALDKTPLHKGGFHAAETTLLPSAPCSVQLVRWRRHPHGAALRRLVARHRPREDRPDHGRGDPLG
jgi:hypothetical protein